MENKAKEDADSLDEDEQLEQEDWNEPEPAEKEIVKTYDPDQELTKKEWDEIIKRNFPELWQVADMALTAVGQLLLKDVVNPFGLVIVDSASSGKTMILNFFTQLEELTFPDDKFTPASFVSHAANRKASELEGIDLLPKIKDKVLIVRDLAPIFSQRADDLSVNIGTLTRVFDGEGLLTSSGVHGRRGYTGTYMFVFLAASTPIDPRIWKTMSTMGSRLFFVSIGNKEKDEERLADQVIDGPAREKELECREATANFVRTLWSKHRSGINWSNRDSNRKVVIWISRMAKLLARFRGAVIVWQDQNVVYFDAKDKNLYYKVPLTEHPDRINQILYNFARSHAVMRGRTQFKFRDLKAVLKLVMESVPFERSRLFKFLLKRGGELAVDQVQSFLQCSRPTALKEMRTIRLLGLVRELKYDEKDDRGNLITMTKIQLVTELQWLLKMRNKWPDLFEL